MSLLTNLISYYKLEDTSDSAGSNTLTNHNSVAFNPALIGNGGDLGASNTTKYLDTSNNMGVTGGAITVSMWIKLYALPVTPEVIWAQADTSSFTENRVSYSKNGAIYQFDIGRTRLGFSGDVFSYVNTLSTSIFNHLVYTYDGTTIIFYLNNVNVGSIGSGGSGNTGTINNFSLGMLYDGTSFPTNAIIDEVGIWGRGLTPTEISQLYNSGAGFQYPFSSGGRSAVSSRGAIISRIASGNRSNAGGRTLV